ncbi:Hydroxyacylglutathione hydrolase [Indibacter alkaliphilus LW1]|jgi:hydroxyacylglutathione hydrolase|uniref:Hydroxyacylglutathione hydrolase n=1 Tax=Indibacter alkaliphilus (strain CCUG 57479 / KCTC 22604 / LW1) TaxID=1189612 RepID=S2E405_INDAL|nr:MBL fold metallo-hydrolase [Indibacter alkaliphilus]EOZ99286.1 Hydroxyacylglutathione hydrolase [Indibacter alkaliphilus LW1]
MLQLKTFTFNPFQENTYILYNDNLEAIVFDPGCYESHERDELTSFIEDEKLKVKMLINTHCHIDHVLGNAFVKRKYNVPFLIHKNELPVLKSVVTYASNYGFPGYEEAEVDHYLDEKRRLELGDEKIELLFVPGHAPGHLVFYHPDSKICIAGDTLFQGSIGRTDLPGGDHQTLLDAIQKEMFALPDDTKVYPGHGPMTTIGYEKEYNPFVGKRAKF